jgi:hypothetical protein
MGIFEDNQKDYIISFYREKYSFSKDSLSKNELELYEVLTKSKSIIWTKKRLETVLNSIYYKFTAGTFGYEPIEKSIMFLCRHKLKVSDQDFELGYIK